jgi:hypothetical protein
LLIACSTKYDLLAAMTLTHRSTISRFTSPRCRAAGLTACSVLLTVFCPALLGYGYLSFPWFTCLGVMLLSLSRFHGVRQGIPFPEFFYLLSSCLSGLVFNAFLPSARLTSVDEILWRFDANFGYLEVPLARLFMHQALGNAVIRLSYLGLPLVGIVVYLSLPNSVEIRRKYCVASGLGALVLAFYRICPAAGPLYLFPAQFPYGMPLLTAPHPRVIPGVSLNCVPSGHVSWALICFWFGRRHCRHRVQAGIFLFLLITCAATLALGEHYVIDLVLAVPFAAGVWAFTYRRWRAAAIDWIVLMIWLILLREGWALELARPVVWMLCAATLSAPWWGNALKARNIPLRARLVTDTACDLTASRSC